MPVSHACRDWFRNRGEGWCLIWKDEIVFFCFHFPSEYRIEVINISDGEGILWGEKLGNVLEKID